MKNGEKTKGMIVAEGKGRTIPKMISDVCGGTDMTLWLGLQCHIALRDTKMQINAFSGSLVSSLLR